MEPSDSDMLALIDIGEDASSDSLKLRFDSDPPSTPKPGRPVPGPARLSCAGDSPLPAPARRMPKVFSDTQRSQRPWQISGAANQEFLRLGPDCTATFNPHRLGFIRLPLG
jgi:hypothetical protein